MSDHPAPVSPAEAAAIAAPAPWRRRTLVARADGRRIDVPPNYAHDPADRRWILVATTRRDGRYTTVLVDPAQGAFAAGHSYESAAVNCHADAVDTAAGLEPWGGHRW